MGREPVEGACAEEAHALTYTFRATPWPLVEKQLFAWKGARRGTGCAAITIPLARDDSGCDKCGYSGDRGPLCPPGSLHITGLQSPGNLSNHLSDLGRFLQPPVASFSSSVKLCQTVISA